jgi:RP/EB family microtubule-associated protein
MATIGMMDSAFFVGRQEILNWLNGFLQLSCTKIEDTANGAVSCQLMDALHPGSVVLNRVDYNATREFECLQNYQVLQEAFLKVGIEKV